MNAKEELEFKKWLKSSLIKSHGLKKGEKSFKEWEHMHMLRPNFRILNMCNYITRYLEKNNLTFKSEKIRSEYVKNMMGLFIADNFAHHNTRFCFYDERYEGGSIISWDKPEGKA